MPNLFASMLQRTEEQDHALSQCPFFENFSCRDSESTTGPARGYGILSCIRLGHHLPQAESTGHEPNDSPCLHPTDGAARDGRTPQQVTTGGRLQSVARRQPPRRPGPGAIPPPGPSQVTQFAIGAISKNLPTQLRNARCLSAAAWQRRAPGRGKTSFNESLATCFKLDSDSGSESELNLGVNPSLVIPGWGGRGSGPGPGLSHCK